MRVIVTGGSGQVGLKLQEIAKNNKDISFFFPSSKNFDLRNKDSIAANIEEFNPNTIVNLAAYTAVDNAEKEKEITYETNCLGLSYLTEICLHKKIEIIHFSTDYVFGNAKGPHKEYYDKSPLNYYGETKSEGEDILIQNYENYIIIRLASVFSEFKGNFVTTMSSLLQNKRKVDVVKDQKISITYAGDVANLILTLCQNNENKKRLNANNSKILHFTNRGFTDWFKVAKVIYAELKKSDKILGNINPINSSEWKSLAIRGSDTRLDVDYEIYERMGMQIPPWEDRVRQVIKFL
tara:strand:- start:575 stop:1456 length:882 start_codon:yes stop_codon:yes gene_type:complete